MFTSMTYLSQYIIFFIPTKLSHGNQPTKDLSFFAGYQQNDYIESFTSNWTYPGEIILPTESKKFQIKTVLEKYVLETEWIGFGKVLKILLLYFTR